MPTTSRTAGSVSARTPTLRTASATSRWRSSNLAGVVLAHWRSGGHGDDFTFVVDVCLARRGGGPVRRAGAGLARPHAAVAGGAVRGLRAAQRRGAPPLPGLESTKTD